MTQVSPEERQKAKATAANLAVAANDAAVALGEIGALAVVAGATHDVKLIENTKLLSDDHKRDA